jgi:hypothetical protein
MDSLVTDKHRQHWQEQGYLFLPQVLSPAETKSFLSSYFYPDPDEQLRLMLGDDDLKDHPQITLITRILC